MYLSGVYISPFSPSPGGGGGGIFEGFYVECEI